MLGLLRMIQTLGITAAAVSSPLARALFPSASTAGGATWWSLCHNLIILTSRSLAMSRLSFYHIYHLRLCSLKVTYYLSPAVPGVVVVGGEIVRRTRGHVGLWDRSWGLQVVKPGHYCEFKKEAKFSCLRLFMWFLPSSKALIFCMKGPISLVAVIFSATSIDGKRWAPSTKRFF